MALLLDGEPQFLICPGGLILNTDKVSRWRAGWWPWKMGNG